jgi:hypothetical protein
MIRWEYCYYDSEDNTLYKGGNVSRVSGEDKLDMLNKLGIEGWELVGSGVVDQGWSHTLYFKREIMG